MQPNTTAQVSGAGTWSLQGGALDVRTGARLQETEGGRVADGQLGATRTLTNPSQANPGGLGAVISASADLGAVTVTRRHTVQSLGGGQESVARTYQIEPSQNNSGLSATLILSYADAELGGLSESQLVVYKSTDGGQSWTERGADSRDVSANTVTLNGVASFSRWTLGPETTGANEPPVAVADTFQATEGQTLTVPVPGVLDNDSDPDGDTLSAALVAGVSNGSLTLDADGSFAYTPNTGFTGSDTFRYEASDGPTADTAAVTLSVGAGGACPLAWSLDVHGTDTVGDSSTVTLGQSAAATAGLDPACGEQELPPQPPSHVFDLRFTDTDLPGVTLGQGTRTDIRPNDTATGEPTPDAATSAPAVWRLSLQSNDDPVTLTWDAAALADSLPNTPVRLVDVATGGTVVDADMKAIGTVEVTNSTVMALEVRLDQTITRSVPLTDGWALVSIPLDPPDPAFGTLLPPCTSGFSFEPGAGYASIAPDDPVSPGVGFWANCSGGTVQVEGQAPDSSTIAVEQGWNAVGPFEQDVPVDAVTSTPSGLVATPFFRYDLTLGYRVADTLRSGRGYWVKASVDGVLDLSGSGTTGPAIAAKTVARSTPDAAETPGVQLLLTDAAGRTATLRLARGLSDAQLTRYALPPVPPTGTFDVRFATERSAASVPPEGDGAPTEARREVELQGLQYPVDVRLEGHGAGDQTLRVMGSGTDDRRLTPEDPTATLETDPNRLQVALQAVPTEFALEKSYPNPATQGATIPYAVPEASDVTIAVYDVLGRRVAHLVDEPKRAGRHQVRIRAGQLPSGTYFVRMRAGDFRETRRLTVVR